jgi:hypothetical protein
VQIEKITYKTRFIRALAHSSHRKLPTARFLHLGLVRQINPYKTHSTILTLNFITCIKKILHTVKLHTGCRMDFGT